MSTIFLGTGTNIRPKLENNREGLITIRKTLEFVRGLLALLVYLYSFQNTKALGFGNLCNIIKRNDDFLSDAHDAGVEADVVLCQVHATMVEDALVVGTTKVVKDDFFFRKRKQLTYLSLR